MEPPNDPFGASKHLGWNHQEITGKSNYEQVVLQIRAGRNSRRILFDLQPFFENSQEDSRTAGLQRESPYLEGQGSGICLSGI